MSASRCTLLYSCSFTLSLSVSQKKRILTTHFPIRPSLNVKESLRREECVSSLSDPANELPIKKRLGKKRPYLSSKKSSRHTLAAATTARKEEESGGWMNAMVFYYTAYNQSDIWSYELRLSDVTLIFYLSRSLVVISNSEVIGTAIIIKDVYRK